MQQTPGETDRMPSTVFMEPWWLDATAPGSWDEVTVGSDGGLDGHLRYVVRRRFGLKMLAQTPVAPSLGPWVRPSTAKTHRRLSFEKRVLSDLIEQLPPFDVFQQSFPPPIAGWLPFHWAGFSATVRVTFRFPDLSDLEAIWSGLSTDHKAKIKHARDEVEVVASDDVERLYAMQAETFASQGLPPPYPLEVLVRADEAAKQHDARRVLLAVDEEGTVRAGVYLVWDEDYAYSLIAARAQDPGASGALRLLYWEAIVFTATVARAFDFAGSMMQPIEQVLRGFGAEPVHYLRVTKTSRRAAPLWAMQSWRTRVRSAR